MRPVTIVRVLWILIGLVSLPYQGITYSERENLVEIGPIQATSEAEKKIPLLPVGGIVAIASGAAPLLLSGNSYPSRAGGSSPHTVATHSDQ